MHDHLGQLRIRFAALELRGNGPHGEVYAARDFTGAEVSVAVLTGQSAADPALRGAFAEVVRQYSGGAVGGAEVYGADLTAASPWVAVRTVPGAPGAAQLLAALGGGYPGADPIADFALPAPAAPTTPATPSGPPAPHPPHHAPPPAPSAPTMVPGYASGPPPGYPMPGPGYPPPGGYPPSGPPGRRGTALAGVALVAAALVGVLVVGVVVYFLARPDAPTPSADPPVAPPTAGSPTPSRSSSPSPTATGPGQRPSLRDVTPISVIGPTWSEDDETFTMAFPDWPFAFRAPATWGCLRGSYDVIPEALAWQCIDEENPGNGQRINVMLWECPTTCTEREQVDMIETWLDDPREAVRPDEDGLVVYVESETDEKYYVDLGHFAPDPEDPDGPLQWHVGVYVESPPESRDDVLKTLNDIVTQTS